MDQIPDDTLSVDSDLEATSEDIEYDDYDYENTQDDHDDDEDDEDASSGNDVSVASLASSIHEYVDKHGRTYHTYFGMEKYPVPADEPEQDRLDMHHEIMLLLLEGKLHLAPLSNPQKILDIGTGTGIWAIDMADKYPMSKVIGTDLSPIQSKWVPPNCRFEIDDAEDDWTYRDDDYFDFIHARNISMGICDWPRLLSQSLRCLQPGGYIELAEIGIQLECDDETLSDSDPAKKNAELQAQAMMAMGRPPVTDVTLKDYLEDAGFVDVQVTKVKQPIGPWPTDPALKQIGSMALLIAETGLRAYCMEPFTGFLGLSGKKASKSCREALKSMKEANAHIYVSFYVVHGRKPRS